MGNKWCPGLLYAALHLHSLLFCIWPIAFFVVWLYVWLIPFTACIEPLKGVMEILLKVIQYPLTLAEKIIKLEPCFLCKNC